MKKIELVLSRLWHYFSSNVFVFIMFMLGCIVCSVGFVFFYGNNLQTKRYESNGGNNYSFRLYEMNFSNPLKLDDILNSEFLKSELIDDIEVRCNMPEDKSSEFAGSYKISSRLYNHDKIVPRQGRTDFSDEELNGKENVIIVPWMNYDACDVKIDDDMTISNNKYKVIGISSSSECFYITPISYQNDGYSVDYLKVLLNKQLSSSDSGKFAAELSKAFPTGELISSPNDLYDNAQARAVSDFMFVAIMFIISLLAFMFLLKFIIEKNNFETVIYSIVGATKKQIICIHLIETMILSLFCAIVGCIVHSAFYDTLFDYINVYSGIKYYFSDYLIIVLSVVVISCLVSLPFIISSMKNSIIRNKNKYDE